MEDFSVSRWVQHALASCPVRNTDVVAIERFLREGDIEGLIQYEARVPLHDPYFTASYFATSILSKFPFKGFESAARKKAMDRFFLAEERCKATNKRIRQATHNVTSENLWKVHALNRAADIVKDLLGRPNPKSILSQAAFTDGTDLSNPYGFTSSYHKYASYPTVTKDARDLATIFINSKPRWASIIAGTKQGKSESFSFRPVSVVKCSPDLKVVPGNRVSFVPKNAKTDRAIAVEPMMNVYIQRAIGKELRKKLLTVDQDLKHGQSTNRTLARYGSTRDSVATIDLSMASDTLSIALVEYLLPPRWFTLLDSVRSKYGRLDKIMIEYEKFSSMGNGYTFELETLVFWSLIKSVIPDSEWDRASMLVAVYGDDLIFPVEYHDRIVELLAFCGFETNAAKSFSSGPFRESCGEDYLGGINVRPPFIKEEVQPRRRHTIYKLVNGLRRYYGQLTPDNCLRPWLKQLWMELVSLVNKPHFISADYGADQGVMITKQEWIDRELPFGGTTNGWDFRFLAAIPDEARLRTLYVSKGMSGQERRRDYQLLLIVALDSNDDHDSLSYLDPLSERDLLLNFSKGNPVKYVTVVQQTGFFSEPAAW